MTKKVQRIIHEIDGLKSDEKSLLIQTLLTRGLATPYVDPLPFCARTFQIIYQINR